MIYTTEFKLVGGNREIFSEAFNEFPFMLYRAYDNTFVGNHVSWHWHPEFEITLVSQGRLSFCTPGLNITLEKGEAVFINSNVLHEYQLLGADTVIYSFLFSRDFLSGTRGSQIEKKYLFPVIADRNLKSRGLYPDGRAGMSMLQNLYEIIDLCENEPFGYEFEIRGILGRFWCTLYDETSGSRSVSPPAHEEDSRRMQLMMEYIHEHYREKMSVDEIAGAAGISGRECARCFRRSIGMAPFEYVNDYRVRKAALALLATGDSILEISESTGFHSVSYFGKTFRGIMGCSPREYRTLQN